MVTNCLTDEFCAPFIGKVKTAYSGASNTYGATSTDSDANQGIRPVNQAKIRLVSATLLLGKVKLVQIFQKMRNFLTYMN